MPLCRAQGQAFATSSRVRVLVVLLCTGSAFGAWHLTWSDEFEGPSLNRTVWNVKTNATHCCGPRGKPGELELYVPDAAFVEDGRLHLRTRDRRTAPVAGPGGKPFNFTSGWVDTKGRFAQRYGRFAANCSLPQRNATGIWPAFWLMPDNASQCWPTGGEIDVFEFNGNWLEDSVFGSYHWAEQGACGKDKAPIPGRAYRPRGSGTDWQRQFHTYAVEWSPGRLDFLVDDVMYFSRTAAQVRLPTSKMFVIFDQAVDSWLFPPTAGPGDYNYNATGTGSDGVHLVCEWVRVYQQSS